MATWFLPLLLLLSPGHDFTHRLNVFHIVLVCALIFVGTAPLGSGSVAIRTSPIKNRVLQSILLVAALILLVATLLVMAQLLASGGNLRENREEFEARFLGYSYLYVLLTMPVIVAALSKYSVKPLAYVARLTWILVGVLLLLTGNRQFVFFSLAFLLFYFVGTSANPGRLAYRGVVLTMLAAAGAFLFSIARLDYLDATDPVVINKYLGVFTGAECTAGARCETYFETLFQLLYAYLGMQYSGITYSIEYYQQTSGFPLLSVWLPVIDRRVTSLTMSDHFKAQVDRFDEFIHAASGSDFSNFFVSMFGTAAQGAGLLGIGLLALVLLLALHILVSEARRTSNEVVYMLLIYVCAAMVCGFMQYPLSEPVLFFGLLFLLALQFLVLYQPAIAPLVGRQRPVGE